VSHLIGTTRVNNNQTHSDFLQQRSRKYTRLLPCNSLEVYSPCCQFLLACFSLSFVSPPYFEDMMVIVMHLIDCGEIEPTNSYLCFTGFRTRLEDFMGFPGHQDFRGFSISHYLTGRRFYSPRRSPPNQRFP